MKKILLTVLIVAISLIAYAQWSNNPGENNRITPLSTEIYDHDLKVSNDGTSFVVFNRPTGGSTVTFLQIIDVNGNMLFSEQGKLISNKPTLSWTQVNELLFVDNEGNAIIIVSDCRNSTGNELSYTLYKVSPTGEMLWGENGIDLCSGMAYELLASIKIVQLEDGTYICAWSVYQGSDTYIQLQRISQTGALLWNEANARIYENSMMIEYPYLVNAGDNNIIVVFSRGASTFSKTLRTRKIDINGTAVWANDVTAYNGGFGYTPTWVVVRVIPDQMGGAFVGWFDDRNNTWTESTYISYIKTNGVHGFASGENGEKIGHSSLRSFIPEMYFDKNEGFLYVAWRETNATQSAQQMRAQKLKISTTELMWGNEGLEVSPYTNNHEVAFYSIQGGGNSNIVVFFSSNTYHPEHYWGWVKNNITLLNPHGEYVWENETIEFSNPVGLKGGLISTPLVYNNYWLTAWNDERKIAGDPDGSKKIYMQRINIDGTLGDNGVVFCLPPTNLDAQQLVGGCCHFSISWEGDADDYELSYRIVDGEWIFEEVIGAHSFVLENLPQNTNYQVRVRSICSEDNVSEWSEIISFHTGSYIVPCSFPFNLNVTEITDSSAKLSWEEGIGNTYWDLRYCEASATSWNNIDNLVETSYFLDELTPNTAYLWSVRAYCHDLYGSVYSEWAYQNEFNTIPWGINGLNRESMIVFASGRILNIINPENRYIEKVQLFDITGKLLGDYIVKSTNNVLIPTTLNEMIVFVKIIGKNEVENYKVLVK